MLPKHQLESVPLGPCDIREIASTKKRGRGPLLHSTTSQYQVGFDASTLVATGRPSRSGEKVNGRDHSGAEGLAVDRYKKHGREADEKRHASD
jgi:hypothetical protein